MKFTDKQKTVVVDLLWDSLKRDPEHLDRRQTGWGTKTKEGLAACIERIAADPTVDPHGCSENDMG